MKTTLMRIAALALAALFVTTASAQYPARPIRLLIPIPPGGAPDIAARVVGQKLSEYLEIGRAHV